MPEFALTKLITRSALAKLAGEKSFARGADYFSGGAVVDFVQTRDAINARVLGSEEYRVELRTASGALDWSCTCPLGGEGEFCKHAVAAGLAWLARAHKGGDDLADLRAHLQAESKGALVEMMLEQAASDPELRARLQVTALRRQRPPDLKAMKDAVRKAFAVRGLIDYQGMRAFIARADSVANLLRDLLADRRAAEAAELAEYAMRRGIAAYEKTDDSGGGFAETLHQIAALHLDACREPKPAPEGLATSLFVLRTMDQWGFFGFEDFAPLLGEQGLARYRAFVEQAWKSVPALLPGAKREAGTDHFQITDMMEELARHDGNVDALVAVSSRDLSLPYRFVRVAAILATAGRHDEALAWAERGRKAFLQDQDARLVEFLVEAYQRAKRDDDAVALSWEYFGRHTSLAAYKQLEKSAGRAGAWKEWREKALAHVRAEPKLGDGGRGVWHWTAGGHTLLVEIFLHEGDSDAALAEANAGGCSRTMWMNLAGAREKNHPGDAAAIYRESIESIIDVKSNRAYDQAAALTGRIGALMERAGKKEEFTAWLETLRVRHKAKRNFMKRLEGLR